MIYIFDLDNTLIFTDYLNNLSYKEACSKVGIDLPYQSGRITRKNLTDLNLKDNLVEKIANLKLNYFSHNLNKTTLNQLLYAFFFICKKEGNICILWSAADKDRANKLLEFYEIEQFFDYKLNSSKENPMQDIETILKKFGREKSDVIVFEDNIKIVDLLLKQNIKSILIKEYLVC